jgi:hypothetical protein
MSRLRLVAQILRRQWWAKVRGGSGRRALVGGGGGLTCGGVGWPRKKTSSIFTFFINPTSGTMGPSQQITSC